MKVAIFGATGSVGKELVKQALERGHTVTAFVRTPSKLELNHPNLKPVQGDVMDYASVEKAVEGQDAVLCALGAGRKDLIRSEGTRHIIRAMEKDGVERFICQTSLGVGDSKETLTFFYKYILFGLFYRKAFADHGVQEDYIKQSSLDWTIVRPGAFTDGERTGTYQHGFEATRKGLELKISRADVADFMLKQLTDDSYVRKTPGLSY